MPLGERRLEIGVFARERVVGAQRVAEDDVPPPLLAAVLGEMNVILPRRAAPEESSGSAMLHEIPRLGEHGSSPHARLLVRRTPVRS